MSRPIQALAPAFLQLLGLKNKGALPPELVDQVQPTIDMEGYYLRGISQIAWRTTSNAFGPGASGFIVPQHDQFATLVGAIEVPAQELWYLHEATARIVTGVSATAIIVNCTTGVDRIMPGGTEHMDLGELLSVQYTYTAAAQRELALNPLKGRWLYPGYRIGAQVGGVELDAAVPYEITVSARYSRLLL